MPVSHLTLTVSHLPTSTSFFLSCLQPLGYQFIGRHDEYIGFGSKPDKPADFWITQEKPGTPAGAAHVAFPAPSKEAVTCFFISALKCGGKIHGEPKTRDPDTGYFSAAVIDFDGNSIEAVYRPELSSSDRSQVGGPALKVIKNGSVVSRARSSKTESVAPARSEAKLAASRSIAVENVAQTPSMPPAYEQQPIHYQTYAVQEASDNGSKTAKTIIGTLLGATAGAAIAYAMVKGDSQPSQPQSAASQLPPHYSQQPSIPMISPSSFQEPSTFRALALEAPPPRSAFSAKDALSAFSRSVASKNPRADTIYEETEYYPALGGAGSIYSQEGSAVRRSSSGSVYATRDIPIRAIEYPPKARSQSYASPSTFISSYAEQSARPDMDAETEFSSISTIKPAKSSHSSHHSKSSSHHSSHHSTTSRGSAHRSVVTIRESKSQVSGAMAGSVHSGRSTRDIPLPDGSVASFSMYSNSKSVYSPRHIPLPESATPSTIFLDTVDVDTHITPDDSISQVGAGDSHSRTRSSSRSNHSSHHQSHRSPSKSGGSSHVSKRSSKFDEPVRPSDSISQVSLNSRALERTVKASGSFRAPSKTHSKSGSKISSSSKLRD